MAKDPYKYFRIEARELHDQLGKGLLDLEKGVAAADLVPRLLRLAHTLKGAARVVKHRLIADHAHEIESALGPFRDLAEAIPRAAIETVLRLLDDIGAQLAGLVSPADTAAPKLQPAPAAEEPFRTVRADVTEVDRLLDGIGETYALVAGLRRHLGGLERGRILANLLVEQLAHRLGRDGARQGMEPVLARVHGLAEELQGILGKFDQGLLNSLDQVDRELRELRSAGEQLRLAPSGMLFTQLERTARDAAKVLGKAVDFSARGADIRVDGPVLALLQPALVQLVRNAVAHGIEPPPVRQAAGKPAAGTVALTVERRGRQVVFGCRDDGAGVDLEALRRAAERKGGPLPAPGVSDEAAQLMFRGGISTSADVTEVAGRGIGLDVVREACERLGGTVAVQTGVGSGTVVELAVPLSVASLLALQVEAAGVAASIPLAAVRSARRLAPADVIHTAGGASVLHEGKAIPLAPLAQLFGRPAGSAQPEAGARRNGAWTVVVVEAAGELAAIGVDRLAGTAQVVLRPLPELVPPTPLVAGATLDVEGTPQLVLDPEGLVGEARHGRARPASVEVAQLPILVIDDSLTTRMLEQSILESAGFEVATVASAEEGLVEAGRRNYGLFLVDVEMPGIDGFTFIERVRADPALARVPAILVTSRAAPEDRRRGAAVGAQGYIVKGDFDQAEFLARIRQLIAQRLDSAHPA